MRLAPSRNFARGLALTLAVGMSAAACSAGEVTAAAGPSVTGSAPPPGTVILADLNGEGAAEGLGKVISVTPETTTTTTTAPPIIVPTTPRPVITTAPTAPETTTTPTLTLPTQSTQPSSNKPPPIPVDPSFLTPAERSIFTAINNSRRSQGLSDLVPEQRAVEAARLHTKDMIPTGVATPVANVLDAVNARYTQLTSIAFRLPNSQDPNAIIIQPVYQPVIGLQFTFIGIGLTATTGLIWFTVIVGT